MPTIAQFCRCSNHFRGIFASEICYASLNPLNDSQNKRYVVMYRGLWARFFSCAHNTWARNKNKCVRDAEPRMFRTRERKITEKIISLWLDYSHLYHTDHHQIYVLALAFSGRISTHTHTHMFRIPFAWLFFFRLIFFTNPNSLHRQ